MPPLPPVPNVLRINFTYSFSADPNLSNRFYCSYSGTPPTNADLNAWLIQMRTSYTAHLAGMHHSDCELIGLSAVDLTTASSGAGQLATSVFGSRTGSALPAGNAVLFNYTVQRRYRGGKPRLYFPWGTATDVADGQKWNAASVSAFLSAFQAFKTAAFTPGPGPAAITAQVAVSYYKGFTVFTGSTGRARNVSTLRPTPVIDALLGESVDPRVASQRRRNRP